MLLVDPSDPVTCQMRMTGDIQQTHLRHGAWLLERIAGGDRRSHFTGRSSFEGVSWSDECSVCILDWEDDVCSLTFHGKHLSEFHIVSAAAALRERADVAAMQNAVLAVLQGYDNAKAQAQSAAEAMQKVQGNGGIPGAGKIILLGK